MEINKNDLFLETKKAISIFELEEVDFEKSILYLISNDYIINNTSYTILTLNFQYNTFKLIDNDKLLYNE